MAFGLGYGSIGLFLMIGFWIGFIACIYIIKEKLRKKSLSAQQPPSVSKDPMIFEFHLLENSEYQLCAFGIEGRHLNKKNHEKFLTILKFLYENEKLRPFPPEHSFKLLKFEKRIN